MPTKSSMPRCEDGGASEVVEACCCFFVCIPVMCTDEEGHEFIFREEACEFEEVTEGNRDEYGNPARSSPVLMEAEI